MSVGNPSEPGIEATVDSVLLRPVDSLSLSARTLNCLKHEGVRHVHQLVTRSEYDLCRARGLGSISLREIKRALEAEGLALAMRLPPWFTARVLPGASAAPQDTQDEQQASQPLRTEEQERFERSLAAIADEPWQAHLDLSFGAREALAGKDVRTVADALAAVARWSPSLRMEPPAWRELRGAVRALERQLVLPDGQPTLAARLAAHGVADLPAARLPFAAHEVAEVEARLGPQTLASLVAALTPPGATPWLAESRRYYLLAAVARLATRASGPPHDPVELVERTLAGLTPRESLALRRRHLEGRTFAEIADELGRSVERARQIEAKAMRKARCRFLPQAFRMAVPVAARLDSERGMIHPRDLDPPMAAVAPGVLAATLQIAGNGGVTVCWGELLTRKGAATPTDRARLLAAALRETGRASASLDQIAAIWAAALGYRPGPAALTALLRLGLGLAANEAGVVRWDTLRVVQHGVRPLLARTSGGRPRAGAVAPRTHAATAGAVAEDGGSARGHLDRLEQAVRELLLERAGEG